MHSYRSQNSFYHFSCIMADVGMYWRAQLCKSAPVLPQNQYILFKLINFNKFSSAYNDFFGVCYLIIIINIVSINSLLKMSESGSIVISCWNQNQYRSRYLLHFADCIEFHFILFWRFNVLLPDIWLSTIFRLPVRKVRRAILVRRSVLHSVVARRRLRLQQFQISSRKFRNIN